MKIKNFIISDSYPTAHPLLYLLSKAKTMSNRKQWASFFIGLVLIATNSSVALACDGGTCGGGGSITSSSPNDVQSTIQNIMQDGMQEYFSTLSASMDNVTDPQLRALFNKMLTPVSLSEVDCMGIPMATGTPDQATKALKYLENNLFVGGYGQMPYTHPTCSIKSIQRFSVVNDLQSSPPVFNKKGPCMAVVGPQDAAVSADRPGASICFSIPSLTRLPKAQLQTDLTALVANEVSHHYGADEALAKKVQNFFFGWITQMNVMSPIVQAYDYNVSQMQQLLKDLKHGAPPSQICAQLGYLYGFEESTANIILDISNQEAIYTKETDTLGIKPDDMKKLAGLSIDMDASFFSMFGYCGQSAGRATVGGDPDQAVFNVPAQFATPAVAQGDRKALIKDLQTDAAAMQQGESLLPFNTPQSPAASSAQ